MTIKIGADPEFFVRKNRHYLSGHLFACGTKHAPVRTANGHVQVDGIALEVNVTPASTRADFIKNVVGVVDDVTEIMNRTIPGCELVSKPSIFFGSRKLAAIPEENSKLGCEPDWNAWEARMNPRPNARVPFRTGAGHIHIGWTENQNPRSRRHLAECIEVTKQLDYYLGLPSLLWDADERRRTLYGAAGAFRPKPYGVEYRVLSNAWVTQKNDLIGWIFDQTVKAMSRLRQGKALHTTYYDLAKHIIAENDTDWRSSYTKLAGEILS